MERRDKEKKSAHLKGLEEVFERRTRRFSPFEVLGLTAARDSQVAEAEEINPAPGVGLDSPPLGGSSPPLPGTMRPTPELDQEDPQAGRPSPGAGRPTRVVVFSKNTTTEERPSPGVDLKDPSEGVLDTPISGPGRPGGGSREVGALGLVDIVAATQLGSRLGAKVRQVVGYLNGIRSLEHDSYTVPVGYGQISMEAGLGPDYLRRKVLRKLAMLGLIGVPRKSLEGGILPPPARPRCLRRVHV